MRPAFVSKSRSLSSDGLISDQIKYSPLNDEFAWLSRGLRAADPNAHYLISVLMNYNVVLFHEQNHRLIRKWFPPHPELAASLAPRRRYHNLQEAWVGTLDILLSDELPSSVSSALSAAGVLYSEGPSPPRYAKRADILESTIATLQSSWLRLEGFDLERAQQRMVRTGNLRSKVQVAGFLRGCVGNDGFDQITNPFWQAAYGLEAARTWSRRGRGALRKSDIDGIDASLCTLARTAPVVMKRFGL